MRSAGAPVSVEPLPLTDAYRFVERGAWSVERTAHGSQPRARRSASGIALTELLLALPVFFFLLLALVRVTRAQAVLAPAHHAARYAAWSQAAEASATASLPPAGTTVGDAVRAAGAPAGAQVTVETLPDTEGEAAARRAAPLHASVFAVDLSQAGRAVATARVAEDRGAPVRLFPPATSTSRVTVPVGPGRPKRPGWMATLGEGPQRFAARAYGGGE